MEAIECTQDDIDNANAILYKLQQTICASSQTFLTEVVSDGPDETVVQPPIDNDFNSSDTLLAKTQIVDSHADKPAIERGSMVDEVPLSYSTRSRFALPYSNDQEPKDIHVDMNTFPLVHPYDSEVDAMSLDLTSGEFFVTCQMLFSLCDVKSFDNIVCT
jgi:hypothetical protein